MKTITNKDDILSKDDLNTIEVEVPEWDAKLKLRVIPGNVRDRWDKALLEGKVKSNIRAKLLVYCIVDDEGKCIFTEADAQSLGNKSGAALDRLFEAACALNKMGPADIEDAAKN